MDKHTHITTQLQAKSPSFIEFWVFIASQIGACRLDINPDAKTIEHLFCEGSVHDEYLKQLIVGSFYNKAGRLSQPIDLIRLLDELGDVAFTLRQRSADDLFDIELLEEIAWHISQKFDHLINIQENEFADANSATNTATLISIKRFRANTNRRR